MKLYFVRHGESEANVLQVISNRGWMHPLTEKGRQQANTLAEKLRGAGITKIYTSPLRRAVETAEILSRSLADAPPSVEPVDRSAPMGESHRSRRKLSGYAAAFRPFAGAHPSGKAEQPGEPGFDRPRRSVLHHAASRAVRYISPVYRGPGFSQYRLLVETGPQGLACLEWCGAKVSGAQVSHDNTGDL